MGVVIPCRWRATTAASTGTGRLRGWELIGEAAAAAVVWLIDYAVLLVVLVRVGTKCTAISSPLPSSQRTNS